MPSLTNSNLDGVLNPALNAVIAVDPAATRTSMQTGKYLGSLPFFPKSQPGDIIQGATDGAMFIYNGEVWNPLYAQTYAKFTTYVAAIEAAASKPTTGWNEFKARYHAFLDALNRQGLLDILVDGCYYGTDGQVTSGAPLSFSGSPATTMTGPNTRSLLGVEVATGSQLVHTVPGVTGGTLIGDGFYDYLTAATAFINGLFDGVLSTVVAQCTGGDTAKILFRNVGTIIESSSTSNGAGRVSWMRNRDRHIISLGFGGGVAADLWVNGILALLSNKPIYTGPALPFVSIGPKVKNMSWLLFSRRLTLAENKYICKAIGLLDKRPINLLIEGDSTSEALFDLTRCRFHWPEKILDKPGFMDSVRIGFNGASSGYAVNAMLNDFTPEVLPLICHGKRNIYFLAGGINDFESQSRAASAVYADLMSLTASARAAGCEVLIATVAKPSPTIHDAKYNELNTLIRNGYAAGHFDLFADVANAIPDHLGANADLWWDAAHLNGLGNDIVAGLIANAILAP